MIKDYNVKEKIYWKGIPPIPYIGVETFEYIMVMNGTDFLLDRIPVCDNSSKYYDKDVYQNEDLPTEVEERLYGMVTNIYNDNIQRLVDKLIDAKVSL